MSRQYRTCPFCKSHLDFGEKCDCRNEEKKQEEFYQSITGTEKGSGQMSFVFGREAGYTAQPAQGRIGGFYVGWLPL